jgi:hypothetical protein
MFPASQKQTLNGHGKFACRILSSVEKLTGDAPGIGLVIKFQIKTAIAAKPCLFVDRCRLVLQSARQIFGEG